MISWNLGPLVLDIHAAQPYIAQAMRKKAAIVMLREIRIFQGSKFGIQREFRRKYPEYECCIVAGSDIHVYNDGRVHITVVTFLHKRLFHFKANVVNWHKLRKNRRWNTWPMNGFVA